jgi:hypothetical protein
MVGLGTVRTTTSVTAEPPHPGTATITSAGPVSHLAGGGKTMMRDG